MRKAIISFLLFSALFVCRGASWATDATSSAASSNVSLGLSADGVTLSGKDATQADIASVATQRALRIVGRDWWTTILSKCWNFLGDSALKMMFYIYDSYIGSFLIFIPNMADQATYQRAGAPDGPGAVHAVKAILQVSRAIGLWFLLVLSVANIAQGASGLSNVTFTEKHIVRTIICFVLLCAWSPIFGLLTQLFTAIGFSFYTSCTLNTGSVFSSLSDFQITAVNTVSQVSKISAAATSSRAVLINSMGVIWNVVYTVSIILIALGIILGAVKFSGGDRQGITKIITALVALVAILCLPWLFSSMVQKGFPNIGVSSTLFSPLDSFNGSVTPILPAVTAGPTTSSAASTTLSTAASVSQDEVDNMATSGAGIFKVLMALWGCFIVIGVLFMKFTQIIMIGILFMLGPIFIGLAAHPMTSSISMGALRNLIKLLAYSPVWALSLVFLYIIPNVDFGVASVGVNTLMTVFGVFAALQLVSDTKEIAGLFSNFGGAASGGNISARSPFTMMAGAVIGTSSHVRGVAGVANTAGKVGIGVATAGAGLAVAGVKAAGNAALKSANSAQSKMSGAGQGGLSPSSDVSPKNLGAYANMMSTQPATAKNIENLGRVIQSSSRQNYSNKNNDDLVKCKSIQNRMQTQIEINGWGNK